MSERKAIHYGQVELIPGIVCDGYVLDDQSAAMSERGTADLLGMDQKLLNRMRTNWPPKSIEPFIDKGLSMRTNLVEVIAKNSPYQGRKIAIYSSSIIENLIRSYVLALANRKLRENQRHIGEQCAVLLTSLVRTALDAAIKEACGFTPEIQKIAQKNYIDVVSLIQEMGFTCSVSPQIATKKDIVQFLQVPESTLNSFLRNHADEVQHIRLDCDTISNVAAGAKRMNGYTLENVAKIALGMNTEVGMELKKRMFGHAGIFARPDASDEIQWKKELSEIFQGFDFRCHHPVGKYRVDFFVADLMLVLECNGYDCHRYYDPQEEEERERYISQRYAMVRFHHKIGLKRLFNGILQAKPGTIVKLYDVAKARSGESIRS